PSRPGSAPDAGIAYVVALLRHPPGEISRRCVEWSVPVDSAPALTREEARVVWAFRRTLPDESSACFDALPVPVRRQVATLYRDVLSWGSERTSPGGAPAMRQ